MTLVSALPCDAIHLRLSAVTDSGASRDSGQRVARLGPRQLAGAGAAGRAGDRHPPAGARPRHVRQGRPAERARLLAEAGQDGGGAARSAGRPPSERRRPGSEGGRAQGLAAGEAGAAGRPPAELCPGGGRQRHRRRAAAGGGDGDGVGTGIATGTETGEAKPGRHGRWHWQADMQ